MGNSPFDKPAQVRDWVGEILDYAPERIHVVDCQGIIRYVNLFDARSGNGSSLIGTSIFALIHPEDHAAVRKTFGHMVINEVPDHFDAVLTFGEKAQQFRVDGIPIKDGQKDGKLAALALFYHEVPSTRAEHTALQQRTKELENRLAERNQKLEEYIRYLDAGGNLNIQLTRLSKASVVLQTLAEQVMTAMNTGFTAIYKVEKDWIEYAAGVNSPVLHHRRGCLDDDGILGKVLRTNDMLFFPKLDDETAHHLWRSYPNEFNLYALMIVPLICTEAIHGILYLGYDSPTHFDKNDELVLRASIEATIDTLRRIHVVEQLEQNIHAREQEIAVLYDLSTYSSEPVELDELLQKSLRRIMKATQCGVGLIFHFTKAGEEEEIVSCWPQTGIPEPVKLFLRESSLPKRPRTGDPYLIISLPPDNAFACITVPIHNKGNPECFLRLFGDQQDLHHPEIVHLIISAARQLGLSIDSSLDRKRAEDAIVLEERQRMARNLHDSITQSLYALALSGDVALKALERMEDDRLRSALEDITSSSLQALKEMRLMLFELRPFALEKAGLIEALELRLNTVERRSGMEASLECSDRLQVSDAVEAELYHIISEALNNSLRHSGARAVRVSIRPAVNLIAAEVEDDGVGFDLSSLPQGGIGLNSMSDRVHKLGGNLSIFSRLGHGTRLSFKIRIKEIADG
jgi:signal transduction histidine kinase